MPCLLVDLGKTKALPHADRRKADRKIARMPHMVAPPRQEGHHHTLPLLSDYMILLSAYYCAGLSAEGDGTCRCRPIL